MTCEAEEQKALVLPCLAHAGHLLLGEQWPSRVSDYFETTMNKSKAPGEAMEGGMPYEQEGDRKYSEYGGG